MNRNQNYFYQSTGVHLSTARQRLIKKILFNLAQEAGRDECFVCGDLLSLEDFTLEHKKPWLYEDNTLELYMNVDNIGFSHHACNSGRSRKDTPGRASKAKSQEKYDENHKFCPGCKETKKLEDFSKHSARASGREVRCRRCRSSIKR
ncbi:hypothetical protein LCGC14_1582910 [marine sediment metagenome]|uniref:HNH domain-containing protein n=1 Tax=marine sediment metagenome TaxID=412755 RepID=A0A0F9IGK7_9ZZZZ